jgi:hypothetical protein
VRAGGVAVRAASAIGRCGGANAVDHAPFDTDERADRHAAADSLADLVPHSFAGPDPLAHDAAGPRHRAAVCHSRTHPDSEPQSHAVTHARPVAERHARPGT